MAGLGVIMAGEPVVDMRWGVYRKVYSGFIWGDRLNSVSMEAEAWFWRLHAVADDLGNLATNWPRLCVEAGGKRNVSPEQAERLTRELADVKLIRLYQVGSDNYAHIYGFEDRQPANKNGRRIQRHPTPSDQTHTEPVRVCLGNPTEPDSDCRESKSPNPIPKPIPKPIPTNEPAAPPPFPPVLDREDFRKAWGEYVAYRREGKLKPLRPRSVAALFDEMARWGPDAAIQAIRTTIAKGWTGVFEPKGEFGRPLKPPPKPGPEKLDTAGQAAFKAWWRALDPGGQAAFAQAKGVAVSVVNENVNWQRVPAAWGDAIGEGKQRSTA